jgi:hypothetical protein
MAVFWVVLIALMMEAAGTSETLVKFYQTTRRYKPEDSHLQTVIQLMNMKIYKIIILIVLYVCQTWSLTPRKEHRLRVFENKVLKRMCGPKNEEVHIN